MSNVARLKTGSPLSVGHVNVNVLRAENAYYTYVNYPLAMFTRIYLFDVEVEDEYPLAIHVSRFLSPLSFSLSRSLVLSQIFPYVYKYMKLDFFVRIFPHVI